MFGTKDKTKDILDSIWCDEYYIVAAREDAPSKGDLKNFFKSKGISLSNEYMAHATNFWGSFYLEVKEEFWPRADVGDVGPFWTFLYGILVYTYSDEAPEWMDIRRASEEFSEMGHNVIPILKVMGNADPYCFNVNGEIVRYSHEEDAFELYDGTFFELLKYEVSELNERIIKKQQEH